MFTAVTQAI